MLWLLAKILAVVVDALGRDLAVVVVDAVEWDLAVVAVVVFQDPCWCC